MIIVLLVMQKVIGGEVVKLLMECNLYQNVVSHNYSHDAKQIRDDFNAYFISPQGSVPWQMDVIRRTVSVFDKA